MININDSKIAVDIFLKVTNQDSKDVFDIIYDHIKVTKRNPEGYTWWGNNQPFSPEKLNKFFEAGKKPKTLLVIPRSSGGNGNIMFTADILGSEKYANRGFPSDDWRPKYYFTSKHKIWLKLANFKEVKHLDVKDYYLISNNDPLILKLSTQYACGYVYRNIYEIKDENENSIKERSVEYPDAQNDRGFLEGDKKLKYHIEIERNNDLIKEAKKEFKRKHGKLFCEICKFDFNKKYGDRGKDFIEGHHKTPLYKLKGEKIESNIKDIVMLCSNCHSMIHAKRDDFSVDDLIKTIK